MFKEANNNKKDITIDDIKKLSDFVNDVLTEQEKQKARGLNNYNILTAVRRASEEVGLHSNIIYSFLNPNGTHFQGELFLNLFIDKVLLPKLGSKESFGDVFSVKKEEHTDKNRRIDFVIKSDKYLIGIEMKVNSGDQHKQINDYYDQLKKESDKTNKQKVVIFYLTKKRSNPSKDSKGDIPEESLKCISFKDDILKWLDACKSEVRNITNLNHVFEIYIQVVKKITNQYKGEVVTIEEEIFEDENKKVLRNIFKLEEKMDAIKAENLYRFFERVDSELHERCQNLNNLENVKPSNFLINKTKCLNKYSNQNNKPKHFGRFYEIPELKEKGLYLYIMLATTYIYYGFVRMTNNGELYEIEDMNENEISCDKLEFKSWDKSELKWFANKQNEKMSYLKPENLLDVDDFVNDVREAVECVKGENSL